MSILSYKIRKRKYNFIILHEILIFIFKQLYLLCLINLIRLIISLNQNKKIIKYYSSKIIFENVELSTFRRKCIVFKNFIF